MNLCFQNNIAPTYAGEMQPPAHQYPPLGMKDSTNAGGPPGEGRILVET